MTAWEAQTRFALKAPKSTVVSTNGDFCVCVTGSRLIVCSSSRDEPLQLEGHSARVETVCLSPSFLDEQGLSCLLCSSSGGQVYVWQLWKIRDEQISATSRRVTLFDATVSSLAWSPDSLLVAVCCASDVYIFSCRNDDEPLVLSGHREACVATFLQHSLMLSASEDRTFKIWDTSTGDLMYSSSILSSSSLVCSAADCHAPRFAVASDDGTVRIYDYGVGADRPLLLHETSPGTPCNSDHGEDVDVFNMPSFSALAMFFHDISEVEEDPLGRSAPPVQVWRSVLFVAYPHAVIAVDSWTCESMIVATGPIAVDCDFGELHHSSDVACCVIDGSKLSLLSLQMKRCQESTSGIAVFAQPDPPAGRTSSNQTGRGRARGRRGRARGAQGRGVVDKPVAFRRKIQSSGYGVTHAPMKLGQSPSFAKRKAKPKAKGSRMRMMHNEYSSQGPPVFLESRSVGARPLHASLITGLAYCGDAKSLASCSTDGTVRVLRLPSQKYSSDGLDWMAHEGVIVNSVAWAHAGNVLMTSAVTGVKLWSADMGTLDGRASRDPLLVVPRVKAQDFGLAQFFHVDRLLLTSSGSDVLLYDYSVAAARRSEVQRDKTNRCKVVTAIGIDAQAVAAFCCVNGFASNIVVAAGSDKTITVIDVHQEARVAEVPEAHARKIIAMKMVQPSAFSSYPDETYSVFMSGGLDGAIRLCLRSMRTTRLFEAHTWRQGTATAAGVAFSPCMRYIGCASEDGVCLYDVRQGTCVSSENTYPSSMTVGVSAVDFSPAHPQMVTGTLEGCVSFWNDSPRCHP